MNRDDGRALHLWRALSLVPPRRARYLLTLGATDPESVERWADEAAVRTTSADRRAAARTIAKVALAKPPAPAVLGIATHGVAARASALIDPPPAATTVRRAATAAVVLTTTAFSITQVHHTVEFALHALT